MEIIQVSPVYPLIPYISFYFHDTHGYVYYPVIHIVSLDTLILCYIYMYIVAYLVVYIFSMYEWILICIILCSNEHMNIDE